MHALVEEIYFPRCPQIRARLSELANSILDVGTKVAALDRHIQQQEAVAKQIAEMAEQLKVPKTDQLIERARALRAAIQNELDELVQAETEKDKLVEALRLGEQALKEQNRMRRNAFWSFLRLDGAKLTKREKKRQRMHRSS